MGFDDSFSRDVDVGQLVNKTNLKAISQTLLSLRRLSGDSCEHLLHELIGIMLLAKRQVVVMRLQKHAHKLLRSHVLYLQFLDCPLELAKEHLVGIGIVLRFVCSLFQKRHELRHTSQHLYGCVYVARVPYVGKAIASRDCRHLLCDCFTHHSLPFLQLFACAGSHGDQLGTFRDCEQCLVVLCITMTTLMSLALNSTLRFLGGMSVRVYTLA